MHHPSLLLKLISPVNQHKTPRDRSNLAVLSRRIGQNAFWATLTAVLSRGFPFIAIFVAARLLGPREFGVFGFAQTLTMTSANIGAFGLGMAATKWVAK